MPIVPANKLWALTPPPTRRAQQQRREDAEARRRRRIRVPEVEQRRQIQTLQARQQRKRRQEAVLPLTPWNPTFLSPRTFGAFYELFYALYFLFLPSEMRRSILYMLTFMDIMFTARTIVFVQTKPELNLIISTNLTHCAKRFTNYKEASCYKPPRCTCHKTLILFLIISQF